MTCHRIALSILAATLALAACDRQALSAADAPAPDAPAPDAPPAADPATGVDATAVVDRTSPPGADVGFDARAFAGRFSAEGAALQLLADGSYTFTVHAESADADLAQTGTWTVEDDGATLRLDPDDKEAADRLYAIGAGDTLAQAGGGQVLQREAR